VRDTIKENRAFKRMYAKAKSVVTPSMVVYCRRGRFGKNRLGVTVSTKLGGAVVRNRARRRLREVFRLAQPAVGGRALAEADSRFPAGLPGAGTHGGGKMKRILVRLIRFYQRSISPGLPPRCRFIPTCSQYALEAVEKYGAARGGWLALRRFLRCHPFYKGPLYDPVP